MRPIVLVLVWLCVLIPGTASAATAAGVRPVLRLNTVMHTAGVRRIAVDAAGKLLASVSDDKTLRLWRLPELKPVRIIRPPIGDQIEGQLLAVSLSADGRRVAVGGWTGQGRDKAVYLFDTRNGHMLRRLGGLQNVVTALAFAPDGKRLAGLLGGRHGLRVWDVGSGELIDGDLEYGAPGYGLDFAPDGRLASTCDDGLIRLYSPNLGDVRTLRTTHGKEPYGIAFSPDGARLAVGYADSNAVDVFAADSLTLLFSADTARVEGDLSSVAWSRDGQTLYAAGRFIGRAAERDTFFRIRKWTRAGRGEPEDLAVARAQGAIMDLAAVPEGVAFASTDPLLGIVDRPLADRLLQGEINSYRGDADRLFLSPSGDRVFIRDPDGSGGVLFDLAQRRLDRVDALPAKMAGADAAASGLRQWAGGDAPTLDGHPLTLEPQEISRSHAYHAPSKRLLLGTEWFVRAYAEDGRLLWRQAVGGVVWQVNVSGDGRLAVAALNDGTIRWFRMADGAPLFNLFLHRDGVRWVGWTPEGFFDHSLDGEQLIGYHLNQGPDQAAEFIPLVRLYDLYYRPDLVQMKFADTAPDKLADAMSRVGETSVVFAQGLAPEVDLEAKRLEDGRIKLQVALDQRGGGYGKVVYRLDGVTVRVDRPEPRSGPVRLAATLRADGGPHVLEVVAFNRADSIESTPARLQIAGVARAAKKKTTRLVVLAVGIDDYQGTLFAPLRFAAADAGRVADTFDLRARGVFDAVEIVLLQREQASLAGIEQALEQLAAELNPEDGFVLYLAGHGTAIDGRFHFFPWAEAYSGTTASAAAQALNQERLQQLLAQIPALKSLVILDACYAGSFLSGFERGLQNQSINGRLGRATGRAVLSATADDQEAIEGYRGMGVFTYALTKGLDGKAETDKDGRITTAELARYVQSSVSEITAAVWQRAQTPSFVINGPDFPLASVAR